MNDMEEKPIDCIYKTWELAETVLNYLAVLLCDSGFDAYAYTYHNSGENGFCVKLSSVHVMSEEQKGRVVYFSEFRSSNDLVVYKMDKNRTDGIDEEAYKGRRLFREALDAAKYSFDYLTAE